MTDPKLSELTTDGNFRAKVAACLADLEGHGEHPKIFEAKRTEAQQREKVRLGFSKTMNSFHLKRGSDSGARAADVADKNTGWNASKRFWLKLASAALAHGLGSGILFGLNGKQQRALMQAIERLRVANWPQSHPDYQVRTGWDPAHLEDRNRWPKL